MISQLFEILAVHENNAQKSINLTPSENVLSPLSKIPYLLDAHSRYFLDDLRLFGKWCFPSGKLLGEIEQTILLPLLRELAEAKYVNVRPISGMNCMLIAIAALAKPGDTILTIPIERGGHPSTSVVARRLCLKPYDVPFMNEFDIDLEKLERLVNQLKPTLIYIDQATFLFPIDPQPIREIINRVSPDTLIHYDSSHINGLILGNAIFNPLNRGADCFGGSTHKTLPGPHKGFLATNNLDIYKRIQDYSDHFVSHSHMASVISLAITLIEFKLCGGSEYAKQVIKNTKYFAHALVKKGFHVVAADRDYTECHQIWAFPELLDKTDMLHDKLLEYGIIINQLIKLPSFSHSGYRLSLAEATRLGANTNTIDEISQLMSDVLLKLDSESNIIHRINNIKKNLPGPIYCFGFKDVQNLSNVEGLYPLCTALFENLSEQKRVK